ncbi:Meiotic coiled-coil protein 2 [Ceratocystis fimbriata CBS 114723]|uniref:Meiotic coiled-coil protein 2 n=1 Tax=Ceratocystis fimbriata CBS 114723 TaxID=1035309 RepID=A0A2C5X286_9PEZI|nr:Meiotic coiled-coil protein 2 [Ceratocystis fimbriata CBS 114723]
MFAYNAQGRNSSSGSRTLSGSSPRGPSGSRSPVSRHMNCISRLQSLSLNDSRGTAAKQTPSIPVALPHPHRIDTRVNDGLRKQADKHMNSTESSEKGVDLLLARLSEQEDFIMKQHEQFNNINSENSGGLTNTSGNTTSDVSPSNSGKGILTEGHHNQALAPITNTKPTSQDEVAQLRIQLAEAQAAISNMHHQQNYQPVPVTMPPISIDHISASVNNGIGNGMVGNMGVNFAAKPPTSSVSYIWNPLNSGTNGSPELIHGYPTRNDPGDIWAPHPVYDSSIDSGPQPLDGNMGWPTARAFHEYIGGNSAATFSAPVDQVPPSSSNERLTPELDMYPRLGRCNGGSGTGSGGSGGVNGRFESRQSPAPLNNGSMSTTYDQFISGSSNAYGDGPNTAFNSETGAQSSFPSYIPPGATDLNPFIGGSAPQSRGDKFIVDKIIQQNDQQASIFLQQKLKVGTTSQKYDIVEAIIEQAYSLMVNRFGNFLVQRCFEHGTPEQVVKIAQAIRGRTLSLSMDPFGCHVVQKAFDCVPEEYKAMMVRELLCRIPETVIHRYACHVWQKLFELRWTEAPPQIMSYVNDALHGMWHEVALGETGSLVVQNIFENCLEEDKRPCIEEVLGNIDIVAHGQFGNWCIQHICEHGSESDKARAIDHVIRCAAEYSTDQFASKVVEKCLKIGGPDFISRYLERVCEGRPDRPRIPLIDIAGDQYGNYLIQYILLNTTQQFRDAVAIHIRKHMVSLRGSKFGSRVGMICTNPASATRPGPPMGPSIHSNRMGGGRYSGAGYR